MNSSEHQEIEHAVVVALEKAKGYVTLPHLVHVTGFAPNMIQKLVVEHPEKVRKSKIETDSGESLYMLNTPLSGITDAWNAFRYLNSKKF